ncbi:SIMPL domain-containing protein [Nocardioides sp.]|uniref:SIMPL domain-containing protein n=1 Tax=Nocardioides sp. TaxID=35761 RepID=UPI0035150745
MSDQPATQVELVVRGAATRRHPAEVGTVTGAVEAADADPRTAIDRVRVGIGALADSLADQQASGVVRWSTGELRTWVEQPWSADGTPQAVVHHASCGFSAAFEVTDAPGVWLGERLGHGDGLVVHQVAWELAPATRSELEHAVRRDAVQDAASRAQDYADALGLESVRPVAVADAGLLHGAGTGGGAGGDQAMFRLAASADGAGVPLDPAQVEISCSIDARFVAG